MPIEVKICGLRDEAAVAAAVTGGAGLVGFVFFARSPRCVTSAEAARLMAKVPAGVVKVGLVVDADDEAIAAIVGEAPLDMLQLHGRETPERVAAVRARFGLPVMKAVAVGGPDDVAVARTFEAVADRLLFDARPPAGATRPGGNALPFDWALLKETTWEKPWLLAGGLTAENVAQAVRASGAPGVDVSSGVEDAPGVKNPAKIKAFLAAAATL
jgi:phosphoribosylanthranilate isomerase